ncbi:thioester reductase [Gloeophyllum trabeum ATCC 11539]|uniref:Thioester reductase n=1 Tax=Gloeophyllum trabeum (strain ATCC 11539 / FP-39264 / Madison 617) TaxID=670483 RepID=S7QBG3_GLOTA|nr:thioester reductase [Gloeophyllum trabeum ATCC 11539]EPQ56692.1 thioester reductase [Gloeophyllum trabeum ATCC 11539]
MANRDVDQQSIQEDVKIVPMPSRSIWTCTDVALPNPVLSPYEEKDTIAFVFHTSGSTGMPKPIYQTHRVWTQGLPCLPGLAAFTTTPLYHGGMPDFLRSMMSRTPLYLYSSLYPINATNVVEALSSCRDVRAFLSVPYILKMLSESDAGMCMLQRMRLVSTGGAPLPDETGDYMVTRGIKLVSRLGSSECGFLMSSARDYTTDKEWSWLRDYSHSLDLLRFVPSGDTGTYELIVDKEFPTLNVSNLPDGSFATADLYAKHPVKPHTWKYAGRADDIIVLTNGKKTSASIIENSLRASPAISEALVFGASRPLLGVLILPADGDAARESILDIVHTLNQRGPSYSHIVDEMVVILPSGSTIPKASKGTLLRPLAYAQYADVIELAYRTFNSGGGSYTIGEWDNDEDLFALGITSVKAMALRSKLQKLVDDPIPLNVVYEYSTVNRLVKLMEDVRSGRSGRSAGTTANASLLMHELVAKYGTFTTDQASEPGGPTDCSQGHAVVLTGATGALGAHILARILHECDSEVIVLVRARDDAEAETRVVQSLKTRGFSGFDTGSVWAKVKCFAIQLGDPCLGLKRDEYRMIADLVTWIIHAAWDVNFVAGLESFAAIHLAGTRNLIDLCIASPRRASMIFCSSTAAVVNESSAIPESLPKSDSSPSPLGYSRSKWVAEHICARAYAGPLKGRISIARVGQLCGDTRNGVWNETEAWPLLIASVKYTGCLPALQERPSWLPIDIAARAIMDIIDGSDSIQATSVIPVYHVVNPNTATSWEDILSYLSSMGLEFKTVPPDRWLERLDCALSSKPDSPTGALLPLWHANYTSKEKNIMDVRYDTSVIATISKSMKEPPAISSTLVGKFVASWRETGFLPPAWST